MIRRACAGWPGNCSTERNAGVERQYVLFGNWLLASAHQETVRAGTDPCGQAATQLAMMQPIFPVMNEGVFGEQVSRSQVRPRSVSRD